VPLRDRRSWNEARASELNDVKSIELKCVDEPWEFPRNSTLLVIALGGNALIRRGERGTFEEHLINVRNTARRIADIVEIGYKVVVTHGNGPQVGNLLIQQERAIDEVPPLPLDALNAATEGWIGYIIQQALDNEFRSRGLGLKAVTLVTQVLVDPEDPAFRNPTKFVGPVLDEGRARELLARGIAVKYDVSRGWRRVVPSPTPKEVVEVEAIRRLLEDSFVPIVVGGGGVPVVSVGGELRGVEAVIDKDLASQVLANELNADVLMMLTDVEEVYLNYGTPNQRPLGRVVPADVALKYLREGHFPPGSMGPKVEAAIRFVKRGGKRAIIAHLDKALEALRGCSGTHIIP